MMLFLLISVAVATADDGQIAKFEQREPSAAFDTALPLGAVERCLIRVAGPPIVYRQPDRPNEAMIVWSGVSVAAGNAIARVDLKGLPNGATRVTAWGFAAQARVCAQSAKSS